MLNAGIPVGVRTNGDYTALHLATHSSHVDVLRTLLNHGADIDYHIPDIGSLLSCPILSCVGLHLPPGENPAGEDPEFDDKPSPWSRQESKVFETVVKLLIDCGIKITDAVSASYQGQLTELRGSQSLERTY
ncbi:hypothetical protein F4679DRAFT_208830 [Xylaria curta]|nr:hypothetical protein F4679DRAFT_208830 [Xylaria curta]